MTKLISNLLKVITVLWLIGHSSSVVAQKEAELTQFMNNPLHYNPAFAGTDNAFTVNLLSRLQWVDVKDAPATYILNIHSPINNSKTSLGGSIISDRAGPVVLNKVKLAYSLTVKLNHATLLSFGLSGGVNNYNVNLSKLNLADDNDPLFSNSIENAFKPNLGAGVFLYTPSFYLSASIPDMLKKDIPYKGTNNSYFHGQTKDFLATAGFKTEITYDVSLKGSVMARFSDKIKTYDFALQGFYDNYFNLGAAYRLDQSAALLLGINLNQFISVNYSYDFPIHSKALKNFSSQEISISFSTDAFYVYNQDREFTGKAKKIDQTVKSIRYF